MTGPPTLADLMTDPGELDVSCLDCHHSATMSGQKAQARGKAR